MAIVIVLDKYETNPEMYIEITNRIRNKRVKSEKSNCDSMSYRKEARLSALHDYQGIKIPLIYIFEHIDCRRGRKSIRLLSLFRHRINPRVCCFMQVR